MSINTGNVSGALVWSSESTMSFSTSGTPTLASLAMKRHPSASATRPRKSQR